MLEENEHACMYTPRGQVLTSSSRRNLFSRTQSQDSPLSVDTQTSFIASEKRGRGGKEVRVGSMN